MPVIVSVMRSPRNLAASFRWLVGGWLLLPLWLTVGAAGDQLFACVDSGGRTIYTTNPALGKECVAQRSYEKKKEAVAPKGEKTKTGTGRTEPKVAVPRAVRGGGLELEVSPAVQKRRDDKRVRVLVHELETELYRKRYYSQQIAKGDGEDSRRLRVLKGQQAIHSRNITAIEQELARLGVYARYSGD